MLRAFKTRVLQEPASLARRLVQAKLFDKAREFIRGAKGSTRVLLDYLVKFFRSGIGDLEALPDGFLRFGKGAQFLPDGFD